VGSDERREEGLVENGSQLEGEADLTEEPTVPSGAALPVSF